MLVRPEIFKLHIAFFLTALLLGLTGCGLNPKNPSDEDWCAEDKNQPWTGCWREIQRLDCETGDEFKSDESIGELRLTPDGSYSITWHPFESYTDYAGSYEVNQEQATITFAPTQASGFDGGGTYKIRGNGDLELVDIWFGAFYQDSDSGQVKVSCGYVFH
jgi:hypothetical protein